MNPARSTARRWLSGFLGCAGAFVVAVSQAGDGPYRCHVLPPLAGDSRQADRQAESEFCSIDFSSASIALCPKTWSTSPATLVYDLEGTPWEENASKFEAEVCAIGGHARDKARSELAIFKNSLNGRETSGTFAPASLLYYHFSRLLQTRLQVPVAVLAEFPIDEYRQRVVGPGLADTDSSRKKMLHEGWKEVDHALSDPKKYSHRSELISADGERLWGVFLLQDGHRYGPELNGTRASGWGEGQNRDFQRTAPFIALRQDAPLSEAVDFGVTVARQDSKMAQALPADVSQAQIAWWMNEITEIVILDIILKQQDRIGNIDYQWRWVWVDNGEVTSGIEEPASEAAIKLRVSVLNDNDAGVRSGYANYAQRTGMLEGWHHMDAGLYQRLQALGADFASDGPVATAVRENYRLSTREAQGIIERGIAVAGALRERCNSGALRMDLGPVQVLDPAAVVSEVDCRIPGAAATQ